MPILILMTRKPSAVHFQPLSSSGTPSSTQFIPKSSSSSIPFGITSASATPTFASSLFRATPSAGAIFINVRMVMKNMVAATWIVVYGVFYGRIWSQRNANRMWSSKANRRVVTFLEVALVFVFPEPLAVALFILPWPRNFLEETNWRIFYMSSKPLKALGIHIANSATGMVVNDACKLKFLELKMKRNYRFIIFKIENQEVVVEKPYDDFNESLPADECRYAVFDFDFITDENCQKSKIFFIAWSPDASRVRSKMVYASSKDRFKRELDGIQVELQATDSSEMSLDIIKGRAL